MTKKRKTRKKSGTGDGFIGRLFAQTKIPAHVTEEQDWYLDTPDVRLTRVFTIVLILHVVAVGGILAFKMVEKASTPESLAATGGAEATTPPAQPKAAAPAKPAPEKTTKPDANRAGLVMEHPSAPGYLQYRVEAGDNLVGIAREMNVSAAELRELNQLSEDTRLTPGKWLNIPEGGRKPDIKPAGKKPAAGSKIAKADPKPAAETPGNSPGGGVRPLEKAPVPGSGVKATGSSYQVQKGDTFFGIARQFDVNYKDLMAANGIDAPEGLQAGMTIQIPKR